MRKSPADQDSPWKEALDRFFPEFVALLFPGAYNEIDWSRGYEFLDTELQKVTRDATLGRRLADRLVKVWRLGGEEAWVLVHLEVQGQVAADFAERMYIYNHRIFDRHRRRVASLAVLGDEDPNWRPDHYGYALFGSEVGLRFPTAKLLDFRDRWQELEANPNPFAVVVMAHLQASATRRAPADRFAAKLSLVRMLYKRGYSRENVLELLRLIDWLITLPPDLERQLAENLEQDEKERAMPYVTSFERLGLEKGLEKGLEQGREEGVVRMGREALLDILETRFGALSTALTETLEQVGSAEALRRLRKRALTAATLQEFQQALAEETETAPQGS